MDILTPLLPIFVLHSVVSPRFFFGLFFRNSSLVDGTYVPFLGMPSESIFPLSSFDLACRFFLSLGSFFPLYVSQILVFTTMTLIQLLQVCILLEMLL